MRGNSRLTCAKTRQGKMLRANPSMRLYPTTFNRQGERGRQQCRETRSLLVGFMNKGADYQNQRYRQNHLPRFPRRQFLPDNLERSRGDRTKNTHRPIHAHTLPPVAGGVKVGTVGRGGRETKIGIQRTGTGEGRRGKTHPHKYIAKPRLVQPPAQPKKAKNLASKTEKPSPHNR